MTDLIRLLPDSVANQIAAGEVIQRPASAVKEILENAIDAGATSIKLLIKDAGKTLIQIIDNGSGMSDTDARMSFERHATSKIREAADLFSIRTLGFRGEALASIAAIAQVELKTRRENDELGTCLVIEGSKVKSQEPVACHKGTTLIIKNLFFNVPARRYFLKTDTVEIRHIIEEFQRVALVHPDIEMSLSHNDKPVYQLSKANLKQRIVHIFGNQMNEKLLPVEQKTEQVSISGYIGKPEAARKTRGEQYFFANGRFIRHPYLHHAVEQAFQELIPDTAIPSYFLYLEVDPAAVDVNIHPTKTEVNFQHSQLLYATLRSAVKHSLGFFTLSPQLDFDTEQTFEFYAPPGHKPEQPSILINTEYNPFSQSNFPRPDKGIAANRTQWEKLYEGLEKQVDTGLPLNTEITEEVKNSAGGQTENSQFLTGEAFKLFQVQNRYIVANVKSGLMIVDQQKAHQRILFERVISQAVERKVESQRIISLKTMQFSAPDVEILQEIMDDMQELGFIISDLGNGSFALDSIPANMPVAEIDGFIDTLIEDFKLERADAQSERRVKLARLIAGKMALKPGKQLKQEEMQLIIDQLFACQVPETAPDGSRILRILQMNDIEKLIR